MQNGSRVGADPELVGAESWLDWQTILSQSNITLKAGPSKLLSGQSASCKFENVGCFKTKVCFTELLFI